MHFRNVFEAIKYLRDTSRKTSVHVEQNGVVTVSAGLLLIDAKNFVEACMALGVLKEREKESQELANQVMEHANREMEQRRMNNENRR